MEYQEMSEIKVESFWGAIASFILLQIFGYLIFQTFLFSIDTLDSLDEAGWAVFLLVVGFIIAFLFFQSDSFLKINRFLINTNNPIELLKQLDEKIKLILAIIFSIIFVLILLGYNPLLKKEYSNLLFVLVFYIISWFVSFGISKMRKSNTPILVAKGSNRIAGIIFGFLFFIIGISVQYIESTENIQQFKQFSYFLGLLGLGIVIMLVCTILLEDQIKYI